ncbi:MAG TPA: sigma factor [Solirubrobacterales bacterium]|jgi:RNA polymerase sigma factor (sigma-70 family)|nr:sigma factor [Solirubrobacterales bacterium]
MYEKDRTTEVQRLAGEIYEEHYAYLLRIAKRNAATTADAEEAVQETFANFLRAYDPDAGAPALAWVTLALKRQCWRQRYAAHLDRRVAALPESSHEEPTGLIERQVPDALPLPERIADRDEARRRLRGLKPDERTAIGMVAAGCSYQEVGQVRGWTYSKVNRCLYEGRSALRRELAR